MAEETVADDLKGQMDPLSLYREEVITDRKVGTIRMLTPVTDKGEVDPSRKPLFVGDAQIMTQMGPLPLTFDIPGETLAEAVANYRDAAKEGLRETIERDAPRSRAQDRHARDARLPGASRRRRQRSRHALTRDGRVESKTGGSRGDPLPLLLGAMPQDVG